LQLADPRLDALRLEAVGLPAALFATLEGRGADRLLPLDLHALVEQHLHRLGHAVEPLLGQRLEHFLETARMKSVGHDWSPCD
jgi:hypothetical protein